MPSLLDDPYANPGAGPPGASGTDLLGLDLPRIRDPNDPGPDQGDALGQTYQAIADYVKRQQQISQDRGLWSDGAPTTKGLLDAAQQYGNALMMGTTAPNAPVASLTPAVRAGGKIYKAPSDDFTHLGAMATVPTDQRADLSGADSRLFVTDRGRVLDRFKAADYASSFGLYAPGAPSWARTAPEYTAEWLPPSPQ